MNTSWRRIEQKAVHSNIPVKGIIELTYTCNFSCVYCYLGDKRKKEVFLDRARCRTLFSELRKAGTLVLTFTGGEPFRSRDFIGILEDARSRRFAVRVFTNGSLIGPSEAAALKAVSPLSVDVSLYGASPDTYSGITGNGGHFDMTMRGLDCLKNEGIPVILKIVANRLNIQEMAQMKKYADDMGFEAVVTPLLTPDDCGDFSPCNYMLDEEALESYFRKYGKQPNRIERDPDGIVCTSGRNAFVISPEGDVFPCIQIRQSLGNVFTTPFRTIWNDSPAPLLRNIRELRFRDFSECYSCDSAPYCFFCPGLALLETGALTGKNLTACRFTEIRKKIFENR